MISYLSKYFSRIAFLSKSLLILSGLILLTSSPDFAQDLDVPYVPTPENVVERMLDLADVQPSDYVIDLGSGDGRIVIAAAKRGAYGHGIDLDPERIAEARENASQAGISDQVMFMEQNIFETDFSGASVITMYLLPSVNKKLRSKLLDNLEPGTKIVSHSFDMDEWKPDKEITVQSDNGMQNHDLYYWVIPAKIEGNWNWSSNGTRFTMKITQQFQKITVLLSDDKSINYTVSKAELHGRRLTIQASNGSNHFIYSGRVDGDQIQGVMQQHHNVEKKFSQWIAHSTVGEPMK